MAEKQTSESAEHLAGAEFDGAKFDGTELDDFSLDDFSLDDIDDIASSEEAASEGVRSAAGDASPGAPVDPIAAFDLEGIVHDDPSQNTLTAAESSVPQGRRRTEERASERTANLAEGIDLGDDLEEALVGVEPELRGEEAAEQHAGRSEVEALWDDALADGAVDSEAKRLGSADPAGADPAGADATDRGAQEAVGVAQDVIDNGDFIPYAPQAEDASSGGESLGGASLGGDEFDGLDVTLHEGEPDGGSLDDLDATAGESAAADGGAVLGDEIFGDALLGDLDDTLRGENVDDGVELEGREARDADEVALDREMASLSLQREKLPSMEAIFSSSAEDVPASSGEERAAASPAEDALDAFSDLDAVASPAERSPAGSSGLEEGAALFDDDDLSDATSDALSPPVEEDEWASLDGEAAADLALGEQASATGEALLPSASEVTPPSETALDPKTSQPGGAPVPQGADVAPATGLSPLTEQLLARMSHQLRVELGRVSLTGEDLMALRYGSVLRLEQNAGEPVDLLLEGQAIAKGELVRINGKALGLRITSLRL